MALWAACSGLKTEENTHRLSFLLFLSFVIYVFFPFVWRSRVQEIEMPQYDP